MKKIEEGCLAIVVNGMQVKGTPTNIGAIVRVVKFLGTERRIWEVDKPQWLVGGGSAYKQQESNLQPLDENGPITTTSNKTKEPISL